MTGDHCGFDIQAIREWLGTGVLNLFGRPYAGKDQLAKLLASRFQAPIIGGGEILRGNENLPQRVRDMMERGDLIPIEDYLEIVVPNLNQAAFVGRPLLYSAVGRFHGEEEAILQASEQAGHPVRAVLHLRVDEITVWNRWQEKSRRRNRGRRADDTEAAIHRRLREFRAKTFPALDFYRQRGLLIEIDATPKLIEVEQTTLSSLHQLALQAA